MRTFGLLMLLLGATAGAGDGAQIDWVGDWDEAFREAGRTGRPVMVCINGKDGEQANERAARTIYRDPWFVPMSRRFVMIVVSVREHASEGVCPRFGRITCAQHLACWKALRAAHGDRFLLPGTTDEMISPQHAWFRPDGTLLQRKEYELSRDELLKRMRAVLAASGTPRGRDAPLDDRDRAELDRARKGDREARREALGLLLASEKTAVHAALADLLGDTKEKTPRCELLRALGRAGALRARAAVEKLLKDRDPDVRSFAAVSLEEMASPDSTPALAARARTERDATVRKNLYRALGACGGPVADKVAAKVLLKAVADEKQVIARKHAALALRHYEGAGSRLVRRRLEQLVTRTKDRDVRHAVVYALAYVGDRETTVPVLERVLEETHEDWRRRFVQSAIAKLGGDEGPFSTRWLYWDDRDDPARKD